MEVPSRRRAKRACGPCKTRKRRCDGKEPCNACLYYEYECYYENSRRKRPVRMATTSNPTQSSTKSSLQHATANAIPTSPAGTRSSTHDERSMEANSGVVFPHILSLKLNPFTTPNVKGFGWNLGIHYRQSYSHKNMTWIISREEWQSLFEVYLERIHCIYGFLDKQIVLSKSLTRWEDPCATNAYDHVLCGIAVLALLFSANRNDEREHSLAECARDILESVSMVRDPSVHDAQAWLLRTMYLRCNSPPHAAWMASCTTMHIVEATGIHREFEGMSLVHSQSDMTELDVECRRRTYWLSKLFNTWISFEYGRSRTMLRGASCQTPTQTQGDFTTELISLFISSEVLDPDKDVSPQDLEATLSQVAELGHIIDALTLSQCNLCFALYRRIRQAQPDIKPTVLDKVIAIGRKGLEASLGAIKAESPWWHVTNVPFQFICILLAMDTKESLSYVHEAISTLRKVATNFNTTMVQRALFTVESLVQFSQRRKEQDASILQRSLSREYQQPACSIDFDNSILQQTFADLDSNWANNLLWTTPILENVDWDQFWTEPMNFVDTNAPSS